MKKFKSLLLAGAALVSVSAFTVSSVFAETLDEALVEAYSSNPELLAARAQLRATDQNVALALSGWRPSVSVNGNVTRARNETQIFGAVGAGTQTAGGTTLRTSQSAALQVRQPIFRGFRTAAGTAEAKANVSAQRARLLSTEQTVLLNAATAYLDVLRDTAVLRLRENNVQVLTRQLEATQDRFRVGEITRTDVAQSEARLAGAVSARIQAEGDLETSIANYVQVIGRAPGDLSQPDEIGPLPDSLEDAVSQALNANPTLIAADFTADAAKENIREVRGDLLPEINIEGSYSRGYDTVADESETESQSVRATLSLPLYQGGATYARLRQAKHTAGQRQLEASQARLDARATATAAYEGYVTAVAQIESFKSQITANEIALEGVQREAEVGSRTVLDVLDAEQELLDSRVNLVTAERNKVVNALQLLSTGGNLTAEYLGLPVALYDPVEAYEDSAGLWFGSTRAANRDGRGE